MHPLKRQDFVAFLNRKGLVEWDDSMEFPQEFPIDDIILDDIVEWIQQNLSPDDIWPDIKVI